MSFVASGAALAQQASPATAPSALSPEFKIIRLRNANADETCNLLNAIVDVPGQAKGLPTQTDRINFTADAGTNSILIKTPGSKADAIIQLIGQLDYSRSSEAIAARFLKGVALDDSRKKTAAYLGVAVESPDETLRAQLDLPAGTGLVVSYIDPDGPAHEFIRPHDVLQRIDEQLLVNAEQLAALVRLHNIGEEIKVTVLRQAKPIVLTIKLGQKEVAEPHPTENHLTRLDAPAQPNGYNVTLTPSEPDKIHILHDNVDLSAGAAFIESRTGPITFEDPTTTAVMFRSANEGFLIAFDHQDKKLIFCGPVDSVQEWNALPETLRQKLASWRELLLDHKELGIETRELRVPVLSDVQVVGRLFINRTAPAPTTQPAGSGN